MVGPTGTLRVSLTFPSASSAVVALSASDTNISIPSSVTFSAGEVSQDVSFQIGPGFNANHVFALTGQLGTETHVTYGSQAAIGEGTGFVVVDINPPPTTPVIAPSQSVGYELAVASVGGYSTTIQPSCQGLPAAAACQFGMNPIPLPPAQILIVPVTITTASSTPPGAYSTQAIFSDGSLTAKAPIPFSVGDFAMSISPSSQIAPPTGSASYALSLTGIDGFDSPVQLSVSSLPAGAAIILSGSQYQNPSPSPIPFTIQTQNVAVGTYPFALTGTAGSLTHSASSSLVVEAAPDFTESITPASATVTAVQPANLNITLNSVNGATGSVNLQCSNLPSGAACVFNPSSPTLPANGSASDTLTVQVNSSVAAGTYPLTVVTTWDTITHSFSATLVVEASPDFNGSISPTSATLSVGQAANFGITLNSVNGATGTVSLQCLNVPSGSTCAFNPSAPTLPANGSVTDTLTMQVNSRPAAVPPTTRAPRTGPDSRLPIFLLFAIMLAASLTGGTVMQSRKLRPASSLALLTCLAVFLLAAGSCGGGGGASSPSPPPPPVTFTITVRANGAGVSGTKTLGTLTITVN